MLPGPIPSVGQDGDLNVDGVPLRLVPASYIVKKAPRFGEKISTGTLRYADFNAYESAHAVGSLVGGYGLRRYSDLPDAEQDKVVDMYDESTDCDARFGTLILGPYQNVETPPGATEPIVWLGEFIPSGGALLGQTQWIAVAGTKVFYRTSAGWTDTGLALPASARKGAVGVFNRKLVIGFGASAYAVYTADLVQIPNITDADGASLFCYAFTSDQAAAFVAGGPSVANVNTVVDSTDGGTSYATDLTPCGGNDSTITGLAPGGGIVSVYVAKDREIGMIDLNAVYHALVPFDSRLSTNGANMRWAMGRGGEEQRGSLVLVFPRDHSLWSYQPSTADAGRARNLSVQAKPGLRPKNIRGVPTAIVGSARWLYYAVHNSDVVYLDTLTEDITQSARSVSFTLSTEATRYGQTFTAVRAAGLGRVRLRGYASAATGAMVQLDIYATAAGLPTGTPVAQSPPLLITNTAEADVDFDLSDVLALADATQYAFVAHWLSGATFTLRGQDGASVYSGGSYVQTTTSGAAWAATAAWDLQFTLYTRSQRSTSYLLARDALTGDTHPLAGLGVNSCDAMGITSLFGANPLLFVGRGTSVVSFILPLDGEQPLDDPACRFSTHGTTDLPEIELGFPDEPKILFSVRIVAQNVKPGQRSVGISYALDGAATFTDLGRITQEPSLTMTFRSNVGARRIKLRLTLDTDDISETPEVLGLSLRVSLNPQFYRIWEFKTYVPAGVQPSGAEDLQNPHAIIEGFWEAFGAGVPVAFVDRWQMPWFVRLLDFSEGEILEPPDGVPVSALSFSLLEARPGAGALTYDDPPAIYDNGIFARYGG